LRIANAIATNAPIENKAEAERVAAVVEGKASIGTAAVAHVLDKSVDEIYQEPGFLKRQLAKIGNAFGAGKFDELLADNEHDTVVTQATLQGEEPGILAQVGNAFITKQDDDYKAPATTPTDDSYIARIVDMISRRFNQSKDIATPKPDPAKVDAYDQKYPEPVAKPNADEPQLPSTQAVLASPAVQAAMQQNNVSVEEVKLVLDFAHLEKGMPNILEFWLGKTRGLLHRKKGQSQIAKVISGRYDSIRGVNDLILKCGYDYTIQQAFDNDEDPTVWQIVSSLALLYDARYKKRKDIEKLKKEIMKELQLVCADRDGDHLQQAVDDYHHYKRAVYMCKLSICTAFKALTNRPKAVIDLTRSLLHDLQLLKPYDTRLEPEWEEVRTNIRELVKFVKSDGLIADLLWLVAVWNYTIRYTAAAVADDGDTRKLFYWKTSPAGGARRFKEIGLGPNAHLKDITNRIKTRELIPDYDPTQPLNLMWNALRMMFTRTELYNPDSDAYEERLLMEGDAAVVIGSHLNWILKNMPANAADNEANFSGELGPRKVMVAAEADLASREQNLRDGKVPSRGFVKKVKSKPNPSAASKGAAPRKLMGKSAAVKSIQVEGARQITVSQPYATTTGSARGSASYY
jgi:hypothetical protein